jgi:choline-sulfatase
MRVLLLDLDTLRPDHLGCYGYRRATSPNIDRIAAEGVRFEQCHCSDAPCLPSRAALVSGRFGIRTGVVGHGGTAADMRLEGEPRGFVTEFASRGSLWMQFRQAGMLTASVSPFAERHSAWWFNAGFIETFNPGRGGMESAEEVTPLALDWIRRNARRDGWLLHVNYWDPHTPYRAPASFGNPFADSPLPSWWNEEILATHRAGPGGHGARDFGMWEEEDNTGYPRHPREIASPTDFRAMIDGYDCGIRYLDDHIGGLLEALRHEGVLDDLAVIVTSDHGENLGELGCYAEHGTADAATHRIPLIVRWPGCRSGHVDRDLHYQLDLAPTIAGLLGTRPSPRWQGRSLEPALRSGSPCGRDHLVLSQCCHGAMRAVRFGPWLWMRVYHDFYHLYPEQMLFDVEHDPHETRDLAAERPDLCVQAAGILEEWRAETAATEPGVEDPLETVLREGGPFHSRGALPGYLARLEATGRAAAAEALRRRSREHSRASRR